MTRQEPTNTRRPPPGGTTTPVSAAGLAALRLVAARTPALGRRVARLQAWWAWHSCASARSGSLANAARLAPVGSEIGARTALARLILANWFADRSDAAQSQRRASRDPLVEIDQVAGRERFLRARATKRGLIVVTGHLGPFEVLAAALRQFEPRIHVVFQRERDEGLERLRAEQFHRLGLVGAAVDDGYDVWVNLKRALERDEVVLFHADHLLRGQRGARVRFARGHIIAPTAPVKLALDTGSPIVPMFVVRTSNSTSRVYFEHPLSIEAGPSEEGGVHPGVFRLASIVESYAVRHADQWKMIDPLWIEDREPAESAELG